MRFFTTLEIFRSFFLSAIAGIFFGCLYRAAESILVSFKNIFLLIPNAIRAAGNSKRRIYEYINRKQRIKLSLVAKNIFDFTVFTFFGICITLLYYIALDGIFRIYVLLTVTLFFMLAERFLGTPFAKAYSAVFFKIYAAAFYAMTFILLPLVWLLRLAKILMEKIITPFKIRYLKKNSQRLTKRKLKEAAENLKAF